MKKHAPTPKRKLLRRDFLGALGIGAAVGGYSLWQYLRRRGPAPSPYETERFPPDSSIAIPPDAGVDGIPVNTSGQLRFDFLKRYNDGSFEEFVERSNIAYQNSFLASVESQPLPEQEQQEMLERKRRETIPILEAHHRSRVTVLHLVPPNDPQRYNETRVIPEPRSDYAQQLLTYCRFATEFLYQVPELGVLPKPTISWQLPGENVKEGIPAYCGHSLMYADLIKIDYAFENGETESTKDLKMRLNNNAMINFGVVINPTKAKVAFFQRDRFFIFIPTCQPPIRAAHAPFSEVLPLLFVDPLERYLRQLVRKTGREVYTAEGYQKVHATFQRLAEAISESISLQVAPSLLQEPEIRQLRDQLSTHSLEEQINYLTQSNEVYQDVPQAYRYLQRHGLEHVVNIFTESPARYIQEIQKM